MGGHVDHRYVGPRWERAPSLVLILLKTPPIRELDTTASSHGSEPAEELCGCTTSTLRVRGWGSRLLKGDA